MKDGLKTMQKEYKKMNIDVIDQLNDDMEDMLEMNNEVQDALSRQYDTPDVSNKQFYKFPEIMKNVCRIYVMTQKFFFYLMEFDKKTVFLFCNFLK